MSVKTDENKKSPGATLYEIVRRKLLDLVETEHLSILPSENELMERFDVSRNTLRRAVSELTKEGILQPMRGIGTLVHPISGLKEDSRILLIYDVSMPVYQQEMFRKLLYCLGKSRLRTNVLMLDKENVDVPILESYLRECDAVIVDMLCSFSPVIREHVAKCGKKRICLRWDATGFNLSSAETDIEKGCFLLMRHLLSLGHRRVIYLGCDDPVRHSGFVRALKEQGLSGTALREILLDVDHSVCERENGMRLARKLLAELDGETAVIANNDAIALCAEELLLSSGFRIPEDISVAGFDGISESASFPVPLTTCSGNLDALIQEAIAYLFSSRKPNELFYRKIEPELILRRSTGPAKV